MSKFKLTSIGLAVGAAVAIGTVMSGCSGTGAPQTSSGAIAGRIVVSGLSGTQSDWIKRAGEEFKKKYPKVDVQINAQDFQSLIGSAAQIYSSSNAPDIGFMQSNTTAFPTLVKAHALTDLTDVWDASGLKSATKGVSDQWTSNKSQFGVSTDQVWAPVIYYNKDLFAKAGLKVSDGQKLSADDWKNVVDKLTKSGVAPLSIAGGDNPALHIIQALMQANSTASEWNNFQTNTNPGATNPAVYSKGPFLAALKTVASWNEQGVFAKGTAGMKEDQSVALFASGGAAMLSDGSWGADSVNAQNPSFKFGWFLYPAGSAATQFTAYTGDGLVVPKKAKNPAAAKAFVQFLVSKKGQALLKSTIPIRPDVDASSLSGLPSQTLDELGAMSKLGSLPIWSPSPTVTTAVLDLFPKLILGTTTPSEGATQIQSVVDAARAG